MKAQEVKEGMLILVDQNGSIHEGQLGIVGEPAQTEYQDDRWINFLNGERAPYAPYEFEPVTEKYLVEERRKLDTALSILKG